MTVGALTLTDLEPIEQLLASELERMARIAFLICGDRTSAEDAAAESIARVWRRISTAGVDEVRPYLHRTLVNLLGRQWRRGLTERAAVSDARQLTEVSSFENDSAQRMDVQEALAGLPPEQRAVVVFRYFGGLSEDEIAVALGVANGTVKSRAARGLASLRPFLEGASDA